MTFKGGINGSGSIFQFDPAIHSFARKFDFDGSNGSKPLGSLIQASDGKLYGITYKGAGVYTINGVDKSRMASHRIVVVK